MDWGLLLSSYGSVFTSLHVVVMTFLGAAGGIIIGAIPGMTATMGIALLVPFSFGMELIPSLGLLLGIYCGGMYGGSISAILIHAPGTPAAAATVLDGYPMGQKGEAGRALSVALFSSFSGGIIGCLCMTFLSPLLAAAALSFGPAEMFMLALFGLSVIIAISGKSIMKGLVSAFFGLLICCIGQDKTNGVLRYIPGNVYALYEGLPFIPTLIGLFAVAEVFVGYEKICGRRQDKEVKMDTRVTQVLPSWKDIKIIWKNVGIGGVIGAFIGAIPGAGGDIAAFVSYGVSKNISRRPEQFGKGVPEGVAAAESANNGCSGGAMIPLLSLGVPGDSVTAVLLGAFIMKGITPGPMMYIDKLNVVYGVFAAMLMANLAMVIVGMLGIKLFVKIISVEKKILMPCILIVSLLGAYSINQNLFDVGLAVIFGAVGFLMTRYDYPLSPILLALILGPLSEINFVRYMNIVDGKLGMIFTRPICVAFMVLGVGFLAYSLISQVRINKMNAKEQEETHGA